MAYTQRLAEAKLVSSVGSIVDSYALAEAINGFFKAEVIWRQRSWPSASVVEMATLRWGDWFNNHRLFGPIGYIAPAEAEANYNETASGKSGAVLFHGTTPIVLFASLRVPMMSL